MSESLAITGSICSLVLVGMNSVLGRSSFRLGQEQSAWASWAVALDPVSETAQRWAPLLKVDFVCHGMLHIILTSTLGDLGST